MCIVKTPKIDPATNQPKDPTVIRNPYLDGVGPTARAARKGRSSLRIARSRNAPRSEPVHTAPPSGPSPVPGGGVAGLPKIPRIDVGSGLQIHRGINYVR